MQIGRRRHGVIRIVSCSALQLDFGIRSKSEILLPEKLISFLKFQVSRKMIALKVKITFFLKKKAEKFQPRIIFADPDEFRNC